MKNQFAILLFLSTITYISKGEELKADSLEKRDMQSVRVVDTVDHKLFRGLNCANRNSELLIDTTHNALKVSVQKKYQRKDIQLLDIVNFLGGILGAIISGIIAIWVFKRGNIEEKEKEINKIFDFGEQLFVLIKNINENSKLQRDFILQYKESLEQKPYTYGNFKRVSLNALERARSFDITFVFNTFKVLNQEKNTFIKYYNSIDYLFSVFEIIYNDYRNYSNEIVTPMSNKFIELRNEILDKSADYLKKIKDEGKQPDKFYDFLNNLIGDYYTSEERPQEIDIGYDVRKIIRPIKEELIKPDYSSYELTNEILYLAKRSGDYYKTVIDQSKMLNEGINSKLESIYQSIVNLEKIIENLEEHYAN
jgi:gas vesicle protein